MTFLIRVAAAAFLLAAADSARAEEPARPNVLYIFTDDQSVRTVGCYPDAYPWVKTPCIDALAKEGVRFQNVYMAPYCVPSRITMLTGNLPHAARGIFLGEPLQGEALDAEIREHPFWPQRLRESGYRTGVVGKWHMHARPPATGVDWDTAIHWSTRMGNDYYYRQKMSRNGADPAPIGGYSVDRHTDMAIDFIQEKSAKPWFLWLCYSGVHRPAQPAERHKGSLADVEVPEPASMADREGKPEYIRELRRPAWEDVAESTRRYHECVKAVDENVGRLVEALRAAKQLENTVVVFASDQGIAYGQHGLVHKKSAPYDAALRSPLIFRWPGKFAQGAVSQEPVNGADVVRTLMDLVGVAPLKSMDGMSLRPLLEDPKQRLPREAMLMTNVLTSFGKQIPNGVARSEKYIAGGGRGEAAMRPWTMIRSGGFKYVAYAGESREEEVYDLEKDPQELRNLAGDPEAAPRLAELRRKAADELRATQSGFDGGHFIDFFPILKAQPARKD